MHDNIISTIGKTPLVRLRRILPEDRFRLFAKFEAANPGGSIKDRPATYIIQEALSAGVLGPNSTIVESSSGNMGIGLAQVCAYHRLKFICVIDSKTTLQNRAVLKAYGAQIDLVSEPDPETGEFLPSRLKRVEEILRTTPDAFWPDQYSNLSNAKAHYYTMHEIATELEGQIDHIFCATSTCGTLRGCSTYAREHGLRTCIWAVDAVGSALFGGPPAHRLIPGHGASVVPKLYYPGCEDRHVHVTDGECVVGCRRLVAREAILAGGSSGAIIAAIERVQDQLQDDCTCVAILPDRGERYLDTIYSDEWVQEHFGDLVNQQAKEASWVAMTY
jgi:N-(2-amino-2-carboxyethyl)-L-glutamate synthase